MNEQNKKAMINCLSLLAVAVRDNDEDMLRSYLEDLNGLVSESLEHNV